MQVLHQGGGAGSVASTLHLSLGLLRAGLEVIFVCPPGTEVEALAADGLPHRPSAGAPTRRAASQRGGARRGASARHRPDLVNSQSARDRAALTWLRLDRAAPDAAGPHPQADAADLLPGELARLARGRPGHRGEPPGCGRVAPPGNAGAEAGGDSERSHLRAGGAPGHGSRALRLERSDRVGAGPAHHRDRRPAQGSGRRARGARSGCGHRCAWCSPAWTPPGRSPRGPVGSASRTRWSVSRSRRTSCRSTGCWRSSCFPPASRAAPRRCSRRWRWASR